jgi:hypothetical protein
MSAWPLFLRPALSAGHVIVHYAESLTSDKAHVTLHLFRSLRKRLFRLISAGVRPSDSSHRSKSRTRTLCSISGCLATTLWWSDRDRCRRPNRFPETRAGLGLPLRKGNRRSPRRCARLPSSHNRTLCSCGCPRTGRLTSKREKLLANDA